MRKNQNSKNNWPFFGRNKSQFAEKKEIISLQGYFNLAVQQRLNKERNRIRFRAGATLIREINPLSQKKNLLLFKVSICLGETPNC